MIASAAASLAAFQAERLDRFMATTVDRVDTTLGVLQGFASGPIRQGAAAVSVFRAALSMFRQWKGRERRHSPREDDDALFVG